LTSAKDFAASRRAQLIIVGQHDFFACPEPAQCVTAAISLCNSAGGLTVISVASFFFSLGAPFADRDELDGDHQTRNSSFVTKP
jgi:hypothetical protein